MEKRGKRLPQLVTVRQVQYLTPHMIRVTLQAGPGHIFPNTCEGANCKLYLPAEGQPKVGFLEQLTDGPRPVVRTYTVRHIRQDLNELDIDFFDHGDTGPASAWARRVRPGSFCGISGPGPAKLKTFNADRYLLAADMSALPLAAATLEAMPRNAVGDAFFEIISPQDKQVINAPSCIRVNWLVNPNPLCPTGEIPYLIRNLPWPNGSLQTCIAGESGMIKELRSYLHNERGISRQDTYISGYWKIGLIEDEHQLMKRAESAGTTDRLSQ